MFKVALIEPTFKFCGGDHGIEEKPSEKYAECPIGIFITKVKNKNLRFYKQKNKSFFKQFGVNPKHYRIHVREGWSYPTKEEAIERLMYEVKHCSHAVKTRFGWV